MAKLSQSQSASPTARKANRTGKLELVSASSTRTHHVIHNILQSSTQLVLLSAVLLTAPLLLQSLYSTYLSPYLRTTTTPVQNDQNTPTDPSSPALLEACRKHSYTTQIVSLDPLMVYINNFTSTAEAEALINLGSSDFSDSFISKSGGGTQKASGRTSQSAPLEMEEPLVKCSTYHIIV